MLNRAILIGRLTKDPEMRYTPNGVPVTQFSLAVDRPYSNNQGDKEVDFVPVVVWNKLAELCAQYLRKGRLAAIEGRIQVSSYEKEGKRVYKTEVIADNVRFLESNRSASERTDEPPASYNRGGGSSYGNNYASNASNQDYDSFDSFSSPMSQPSAGNRNKGSMNKNQSSNDERPFDISENDIPF